ATPPSITVRGPISGAREAPLPPTVFLGKFAARRRGVLSYDSLPGEMSHVGARIVFEGHTLHCPHRISRESSRGGGFQRVTNARRVVGAGGGPERDVRLIAWAD